MSRVAGIGSIAKKVIEPLGFTALTTGIGLMSGQSVPEAIAQAVPGVAGSYLGQHLAEKALPNWGTKFRVRGKEVGIHLPGLAGSYLGGMLGAEAGSKAYEMTGGEVSGNEPSGLAYIADELSLPVLQVGKALMKG